MMLLHVAYVLEVRVRNMDWGRRKTWTTVSRELNQAHRSTAPGTEGADLYDLQPAPFLTPVTHGRHTPGIGLEPDDTHS